MNPRERFLAAVRGDALDRPPVWLMRQAGRYLPGYRALRAEHSFWDVCQNPELSTRAALEPLDRYAHDAAIVFSDILVVLLAMGLGVTFGPGEGPRIAKPLRNGLAMRVPSPGPKLTPSPIASGTTRMSENTMAASSA